MVAWLLGFVGKYDPSNAMSSLPFLYLIMARRPIMSGSSSGITVLIIFFSSNLLLRSMKLMPHAVLPPIGNPNEKWKCEFVCLMSPCNDCFRIEVPQKIMISKLESCLLTTCILYPMSDMGFQPSKRRPLGPGILRVQRDWHHCSCCSGARTHGPVAQENDLQRGTRASNPLSLWQGSSNPPATIERHAARNSFATW